MHDKMLNNAKCMTKMTNLPSYGSRTLSYENLKHLKLHEIKISDVNVYIIKNINNVKHAEHATRF